MSKGHVGLSHGTFEADDPADRKGLCLARWRSLRRRHPAWRAMFMSIQKTSKLIPASVDLCANTIALSHSAASKITGA